MVSMRIIRIRILSLRRAFKKHFVASAILLLLAVWFATGILFPRAPERPKWADRAVTPAQRAEVVKDVFKFAWRGYYTHAFPNDELIPLWNWYSNSRNGWGATAVEALGTAAIMDIPEIVDQILDFIPTIDFTKTKDPVDLFETTIRYLGGMLSAYELLTGPMHHLAHNKPENVESLLTQSTTLANTLKFAFDTPTGIPRKTLLLDKQMATGSINTASSIGTLVLEWTRLSDITGDEQYAALVDKSMNYLLNPKPQITEPYPGIVGTWVNVDRGEFTDAWGTWGGGGDSFYEYLIKMFVYDQARFGLNMERWVKAIDSTIEYVAETPQGGNLTFLTHTTGKSLDHESGHLQCFAGGNFILGGKILNITRYIDFGLKITESCHEMYIRTATGIGPETISWPPARMTPEQENQFKTLGFGITNANFDLRPETVESYYYAYRVTKDRKYQDWAWEAFVAIVAHTKTRNGFSPISNVNKVGGGMKRGSKQESFLFSELFKYLYLIFAEETEIQVNYEGRNEWVFSTEGHPLRISGTAV
ncbi:glycoside hydrolase [Mollisia scopiformis]|uniref:alpha-1,2-Mannosidase n=1 Tax=Mollisia scopiformis TaxID=149040 RepID=A0A194XWB7_MOLSC|nr:glycoside hydrolase [Mollisia scopiformis]KUJ24017.1 glycoside hydrolase [Mollisia scopiformis]